MPSSTVIETVFRLAGLKVNTVEGRQRVDQGTRPRLLVFRLSKIDLRHLVAGEAARIGYLEADFKAIGASRRLQIRIAEVGVAEAEAEGKERRDTLLVEPAVADVDAFRVSRLLLVHPCG